MRRLGDCGDVGYEVNEKYILTMAKKNTANVPPPIPRTFEDSFSTRSSVAVDDMIDDN